MVGVIGGLVAVIPSGARTSDHGFVRMCDVSTTTSYFSAGVFILSGEE